MFGYFKKKYKPLKLNNANGVRIVNYGYVRGKNTRKKLIRRLKRFNSGLI